MQQEPLAFLRAAAKLEARLEDKDWRVRHLGEVLTPFLAREEKVRLEDKIVDCAVSIAVGIEATGRCHVLGCGVATTGNLQTPLPGEPFSRGL